MSKGWILSTIGLGCAMLAAAPALADTPADCAAIAQAKFQQWRQPRLQIDREKTFVGGATVTDTLIVTVNTAYKRDGNVWTSAGITVRERAVGSPDKILKDMRLAECTKSGSADMNGQPASLYSFTYLPDSGGYVASGKLWVSDATGLPVREEFNEPAPPANDKVAKMITATYRYNGDVLVPGAAQLAESRRLNNNWAVVRNMQSGGMGLGGPQQ